MVVSMTLCPDVGGSAEECYGSDYGKQFFFI